MRAAVLAAAVLTAACRERTTIAPANDPHDATPVTTERTPHDWAVICDYPALAKRAVEPKDVVTALRDAGYHVVWSGDRDYQGQRAFRVHIVGGKGEALADVNVPAKVNAPVFIRDVANVEAAR